MIYRYFDKMDTSPLPNRDILQRIVVEVEETVGKKETRRVTDDSRPRVNLIRRPGEGSRPLFDRDEIINSRRIFGDLGQGGRFSDRFRYPHSDFEDRLRTNHDSCRRDYCTDVGSRMNCGRCRDDLFFSRRRELCPMCRSNSYYFTECGESCAEGRQRRLYRTLSDERLTRRHSLCYHDLTSAAMETYYYLYEDPYYYNVWDCSPFHSSNGYDYYSY